MYAFSDNKLLELYNINIPYIVGSMYKGISSVEMISTLMTKNIMGYFGSGGLNLHEIEKAVDRLNFVSEGRYPYGVNILCNINNPEFELKTIKLFLDKGVSKIEASAFSTITKSLVLYRVKGIKEREGRLVPMNLIQAKVSRPEVAALFLSPPSDNLLKELILEGEISEQDAIKSKNFSMADCICVESDSGGHTDNAVAHVIIPFIIRLRDEYFLKYNYHNKIFIGAAGGIGTPEAAAAMFTLGVDFIQTGSINQCTVEAGCTDLVKDILQSISIQDTMMAPAGDMFEIGAKVQVLKKGVLFPIKANKLYDIYKRFNSINEFDKETIEFLEKKVFYKSISDIEKETAEYFKQKGFVGFNELKFTKPKMYMSKILQWYYGYANRITLQGQDLNKIDFQVFCGPAMGACNQWLKGTNYFDWKQRKVADLARLMIADCDVILKKRFEMLYNSIPTN